MTGYLRYKRTAANPAPPGFITVTQIDADSPLPTTAGSNVPLAISLHASGASEGTFGDQWQASCGADLGSRDFFWRLKGDSGNGRDVLLPRDYVTGVGPPKVETWWFGWVDVDITTGAHPYTELKVIAMLDHVLSQYPHLSTTKISIQGESMGGWGCGTFAMKRPDRWGSVWPTLPRWEQTTCPRINNATPLSGTGLKMDDLTTNFLDYMDIKPYVLDTDNDIPFLGAATGKLDNFESWANTTTMMNNMITAKRGFVFAWGNFGHSSTDVGNLLNNSILNTYSATQYPIGGSYPIFLNSSLDNPLTDAAGGINLGFRWRNLVEDASGFDVEISNVLGAVTVDVLPKSSVFTVPVVQQTVFVPSSTWVTVSF